MIRSSSHFQPARIELQFQTGDWQAFVSNVALRIEFHRGASRNHQVKFSFATLGGTRLQLAQSKFLQQQDCLGIAYFARPDHCKRFFERDMHDLDILTFVFFPASGAHLVLQMVSAGVK